MTVARRERQKRAEIAHCGLALLATANLDSGRLREGDSRSH